MHVNLNRKAYYLRTRLISPATNAVGETRARMVVACSLQTTMVHNFWGDMTVII